jgi:hypothetical protein
MEHYGRPTTILHCPRCKHELPGYSMNCPKCGPVLSNLGRGKERASHMDFTRDFMVLRGAFYLIVALGIMAFDRWLWYAPVLGLLFLFDPWRSAHQRGSWARGLRYVIAASICLGIAYALGVSLENLQSFDYTRVMPTWTVEYGKRALVMFSYCFASAGMLMWIFGALL